MKFNFSNWVIGATAVLVVLASLSMVSPRVASAAGPNPADLQVRLGENNQTCGSSFSDNAGTVESDGSIAYQICVYATEKGSSGGVWNAGNKLDVPVVVTVSVGVVSTGTSKSTTVITKGGYASTNYRGGGNQSGTDTIVVSYAAGNAVATRSVDLGDPEGGDATKMMFVGPQTLAFAPDVTETTPNYSSPTTGAQVALRVTDAAGLGVNGEVVLLTVDRGFIIDNPSFGNSVWWACLNANSRSITATTDGSNLISENGADGAGYINVTVCGNQKDAPGKVTITASNITTTMANATLSLTQAGRPAKVATTVDGSAVNAKVTDSAGNVVADGTPVRFTLSQNAGAVATECALTVNGEASSVVALIASSGTVIVSANYFENGGSSSCGDSGNKIVATSAMIGGAGAPAPAPAAGAVSSGSVPAAGGFGFFVYGGPVSGLAAATGCPSGTAAFWATVNGEFVTNVPGTSISAVNAAFNAAFPNGIPAGTALLGKCK